MSKASWHEEPIIFDCEDCRLVGIVTQPAEPNETGVLIIVGGPQYRAGSHRQFTLLARHLADNGIASMRFDYRGMGDSEGDMRNFENVDADIHAAIDALIDHVHAVRRVALWGLCDAASAALYYGHTDARVSDLILLNPWAHSRGGEARARLKSYYLTRLLQPSFWRKLLAGQFRLGHSVRDFAKSAQLASANMTGKNDAPTDPRQGSLGYINRMLQGLQQFSGNVLIILSGNDLTAQEFISLCDRDKKWKKTLRHKDICQHFVEGANHTFSSQDWRNQASRLTRQWIGKPLGSHSSTLTD